MKTYPAAAFIRGELWLLGEGGRSKPVFDGYRAMVWLGETDGGLPLTHDGVLHVESDEGSVAPGGSGFVRLQPVDPDRWAGVQPGRIIQLREGAKLIGLMKVTELFPGGMDD